MDKFHLAAGQKHPITFLWTEDGTPDTSAKLLSWTSNSDWISGTTMPICVDLTDAKPGDEFELDLSCSVQFADGTIQTISLAGEVTVSEAVTPAPSTVPVTDPAQSQAATPPAQAPAQDPANTSTVTTAPPHSYAGSMQFDVS